MENKKKELSKMYEIAHNIRIEMENLNNELNNISGKYRQICIAIEREKLIQQEKEKPNGSN